ncbi:hypothetical protein EHN06_14780 [Marinobacter sp. NP-4(2019)]|uniref:hypothetical protein n=1 Tax=Marinobacter sp. NP-4(2019) TaxID=2488665 RepID=UPI000FC3E503|nr:hypothetical protein [Marinobacter sp. NP-4(2019)]AZT84710.1 hypothetical protein EHN06_14780 [Marinobacter sp. NP-4(2019)]
MTSNNLSNPQQPVHWSIHEFLQEHLFSSRILEIVYRDDAGQVQIIHDVIRDLFSRAGQEFVLIGRGQMLRLDHVVMVDGMEISAGIG